MTLTANGFRIAWRLGCVVFGWVMFHCNVMWSVVVLFPLALAVLMHCFLTVLLFCNIITGLRWVFMLKSMWGWDMTMCFTVPCFHKCDRRNADLFFSVISVFTNISRVLHLLFQSVYSRTHPVVLLWEHHPFFICSSLSFCQVFTASQHESTTRSFWLLYYSAQF